MSNEPFTLAVCAEMVFRSLPITERVRRISDLGFQVEIWDWTRAVQFSSSDTV
jgi:hydroxypyruvate isomerase